MTTLLDGRQVAARLRREIAQEVKKSHVKPGLATVLVGDDPASKMYVQMKQAACQEAGFYSVRENLAGDCSVGEILSVIDKLNADDSVHGILVQLPLPKDVDLYSVFSRISPDKDVDGFHPKNMGELMGGREKYVAAPPRVVIMLLDEYRIPFEGQQVVIVNHSTVVGRPLAMMFLNRNATVTVCHVKTKDLTFHTCQADILVSGAGVPKLITADMVKDGAVVVDVGVSKVDGKIAGDVDFEKVKQRCSHISPVPGGSGPMTIAALLENTFQAAKDHR